MFTRVTVQCNLSSSGRDNLLKGLIAFLNEDGH